MSVLDRVSTDPQFAKDLQTKAAEASAVPPTPQNIDGPEWSALLDAVAESPEDRANMVAALKARPADTPEKLAQLMQQHGVVGELPVTTTTTTITTGGCLTMQTTIECAVKTVLHTIA